MEFLNYLNEDGHRIYALIQQARTIVMENKGFCRNMDLYGYLEKWERKMTICTNNIKARTDEYHHYVNETILHEAVHLAQQCRGKPLWISKELMPLSASKLTEVARSAKIGREHRHASQIEHEAYWFEDKPEEVERILTKYCM